MFLKCYFSVPALSVSMSSCRLCQRQENLVQSNLLLDVDENDIATWTYNIISLDETQKLCIECCQNIRYVGGMLFQWWSLIRVSFDCITISKNASSDMLMKMILDKGDVQNAIASSSSGADSNDCLNLMDNTEEQSFSEIDKNLSPTIKQSSLTFEQSSPTDEISRASTPEEEGHFVQSPKCNPRQPRKQGEFIFKKKKQQWLLCKICPQRFLKEHWLKIHEKERHSTPTNANAIAGANSNDCLDLMDNSEEQLFARIDDDFSTMIKQSSPTDEISKLTTPEEEGHFIQFPKCNPRQLRKQREFITKKKKQQWLLCKSCPQRFLKEHRLRIHEKKRHSAPTNANANAIESLCAEANYIDSLDLMDHSEEQLFARIDDDFSPTTKRSSPTIEISKPTIPEEEGHFIQSPMCNSRQPRKQRELITKKKKQQWLFCKSCPQRFLKDHWLKIHEKKWHSALTNSVAKSGICPHCSGEFHHLKRHMKMIHGTVFDDDPKKEFLCRFCPKMFSEKRRMIEHERVHTKEKPFACQVCGAGFPSASRLKIHVSIHTGEKKYKCRFCEKHFRQRANRTIHERTLHKTVQYPCPNGCSKTFIFPSLMKKHIQQTGCDINNAERDKN